MSYADTKPLTGPPVIPPSYPANVGSTPPANPQQGSIWIDNSTPALLIKVFDSGVWTAVGQPPAPVIPPIPPQIFHGALSAPPATANAGDVYYLTADIVAPAGAPTLVPWDSRMTGPLQGGAVPDPANPGNPLRDPGVVPIPSTPPLWGTTYLGVSYVLSGGSTALIARINAGQTTPIQFASGVNPPFTVYVAPPPSARQGFYRHDGTAWNLIPPVPNGTKTGDTLAWDNETGTWKVRPHIVSVPANATAAGFVGQIASDVTHVYHCVATNTWVRVARDTTGGW